METTRASGLFRKAQDNDFEMKIGGVREATRDREP